MIPPQRVPLLVHINSTTLLKLLISNLFVASILHYCSLHRNAQYGLVPFRVIFVRALPKGQIAVRSSLESIHRDEQNCATEISSIEL